ncbi:MAG TPA: hypothetical protein VJH37_02165 [Candidatus Nanoarchaeia archaeon]|nr:hypothetical protein [Candidatus Nanoarchaeia archaeon]
MASFQKLSIKGLFLAGGLLWGGNLFLHALFASANVNFLMWNTQSFVLLSQIYPGITATFTGAVIGLVWGFFCGGIAAAIFGWLYNKLI